jgi:hypothetical protein
MFKGLFLYFIFLIIPHWKGTRGIGRVQGATPGGGPEQQLLDKILSASLYGDWKAQSRGQATVLRQ